MAPDPMEKQEQPQYKADIVPSCPVCTSTGLQHILDLPQLPVLANVLWENQEDALAAPRGDVSLVFCDNCGHVFNRAFDPQAMEYDAQYENSLHFSPRFQQYADQLAHYLVDQYHLRGKKIVEIGSGKGDFLRMLCDYGQNDGVGFDPSHDPAAVKTHPSITFVRDAYSEQYSDPPADLICSRHTLEHLPNPAEFVQMLRRAAGSRKDTVLYFEVPNLRYILRDTAVWDIIYEHYSYYSPQSLAYLFTLHGFDVLKLNEDFDGQFLSIEAAPGMLGASTQAARDRLSLHDQTKQITGFGQRSREKISRWQNQVEALRANGNRAVVWGAGSKGISFLNLIKVGEEIQYVVDINPRKRNKYVTGAGQQIVPPEHLKTHRPDTIIVMNPIYQDEIQATVEALGIKANLLLAL